MALSVVEREYLKLLKPELAASIRDGEPDRAASFARELAKLRRKDMKRDEKAVKRTLAERAAAGSCPGGQR